MTDDIPVKVFVRSRPFSDKEKLENARECLQFFVESNQVGVALIIYLYKQEFLSRLDIVQWQNIRIRRSSWSYNTTRYGLWRHGVFFTRAIFQGLDFAKS